MMRTHEIGDHVYSDEKYITVIKGRSICMSTAFNNGVFSFSSGTLEITKQPAGLNKITETIRGRQ